MAEMSLEFVPRDYPECPGCYLMKDTAGRIVYVGKANNLRQRISSYFRSPDQLPVKTQVMMGKVAAVDVLCTHSEKEALLLEASLIKKHRPRYNIVLRDDKSYILFKLDKSAAYPRLSLTRKVIRNGAVYFGPFTSAQAARQTLKVVNRLFALRKCKDSTFRNRTRPCLQYDMGRCLAPCVRQVDQEEYAQLVRHLELFLSGRSKELVAGLRQEMHEASDDLQFEKAAALRDQIRAIERTIEQQTVVLPGGDDCDALALAEIGPDLAVGVAFIRQGKLLDYKAFFWEGDPDFSARDISSQEEGEPANGRRAAPAQDREDILRTVLLQFYTQDKFIPERIIVPFHLSDSAVEGVLAERRGGPVHLVAAWRQHDKKMVDLARTNALQARVDDGSSQILRNLGNKLGRRRSIYRIECVDVSHLGGHGVYVGQVVLEGGRFRPEAYRLYAFPELEGTRDDYAALAAWAARRLQSGPPWPDLVLIDGGKGQLAAVERAMSEAGAEDLVGASWSLASLAKGGRRQGELEERVFVPGRKNPLPLRPGSKELLFLQHVRDAAHRFVLSRQKRSRSRKVMNSRLENIPGIGPRTSRLLWDKFGSLAAMIKAEPDTLQTIPGIGPHKAQAIHESLQDLGRQSSVAESSGAR